MLDEADTEYDLDERKIERLLPWFLVASTSILAAGILMAHYSGSNAWVDKSGKILVAFSLLLTFIQFKYESVFGRRFAKRVGTVKQLATEKGMTRGEADAAVNLRAAQFRVQFEEMRRKVLLHALAVAAVGEVLSAFGGMLFGWIGL